MGFIDDAQQMIDRFSRFGETPEGGITRLLFDESWTALQRDVVKVMEAGGMKAGFDAAGNTIGRLTGIEKPEQIIATGSHADTVVNGGKLDGQLGIVAGCIAAARLYERYGPPKKTIEVVGFAEEEGSRFPYTFWGSKYYTGLATLQDTAELRDCEGTMFLQAMEQAGFTANPEFDPAKRQLDAFVELHVEQGDVLERKNLPLGVVTGIVAQKRFTVKLKGLANHAGTTMMKYRRDALMGFSRISERAMELAYKQGEPLVLTFGKIDVKPNVSNVISGEVTFTIDCRHTSEKELCQFSDQLEALILDTASEMELEAAIRREMSQPAAEMAPQITELIARCCQEKNIPFTHMHSGAGHDSQVVSTRFPAGMIFVPSVKGISHSPQEETDIEDIAQGIEVLIEVLYQLAY